LSNIEKLKEKPTVQDIMTSIKDDYEKKGWVSVRDRLYSLIIEIGKSPDNPIKVILGYLEKEGNTYRNNQIKDAFQELDLRIRTLETNQQIKLLEFLFDNINLVQELIICATTSLNPVKYKYWANYLISAGTSITPVPFAEIEVFNKLINELIELDFLIIRDLHTRNLTVKDLTRLAKSGHGLAGIYDPVDLFLDQYIKTVNSEILLFRILTLINYGLIHNGVIFNDDNTQDLLLTELGIKFYDHVLYNFHPHNIPVANTCNAITNNK